MKNEIYQDLQKWVKEHHGFGSELYKTELYKKYEAFMNSLRSFHQKKVKISYVSQNDWVSNKGGKIGKVFVNSENKICFFEGRRTRNGQYLDAGLYEGFFAVIIPLEITEID